MSSDSQDANFDNEAAPEWAAHYLTEGFTVKKLFPPLEWVPRYIRTAGGKPTATDLKLNGLLQFSPIGDAISGVTVGVMLIPQCLAFAMLAGLPVQAGLYASFMPLVMYAAFGTIRQVQPGPTALLSLLTGQALDGLGLQEDNARLAGAAFMALMVGVMSVFLGVLRTGFIVDFMSHSVMTAFCTAAGFTIGTSQLKHMFGIKVKRQKYWWKTVKELVLHIPEAHGPTCALSFTILVAMLTLKYWKGAGSAQKRASHRLWRFFPKDKTSVPFRCLKFCADLSSLLAVVIGWLWALGYRNTGVEGVKLVGHVNSTGFLLTVPGAGYMESIIGEESGGGAFISSAVIAIVGFLETMAVGGKFAAQSRYEYDPDQELIGLGLANVASGIFSGYPVTGSFTRTAVNAQFGATSLVACAMASFLVFLAVYVLLPVIALLPLSSLAPIIIQGALGVISLKDFHTAYHSAPSELLVMLATFIMSLALTVKEGLLAGFALSVMKTMYDLANPNLVVLGRLPEGNFRDIRNFPQAVQLPGAVMVRMDARLNFANTRKMKEFCLKAVAIREATGETIDWVIVDCKSINHVDLTGGEMLEVLAETLKGKNQRLVLINVKGPVGKCLTLAHVPRVIRAHGGHVCIDLNQCFAIMSKADPSGDIASKALHELVKSVDEAKKTMGAIKAEGSVLKCVAGAGPKPAVLKDTPIIDPSDNQPDLEQQPAGEPQHKAPLPAEVNNQSD